MTSDVCLMWLSHCVDISLPEPMLGWPALSLPHHFFNHFLMIQTALRYRSFLWADAAQIPLCIAISSLLTTGLSATDGIVKKQIWAESRRTSLLSEHAFPSDESTTIRIWATPAGRVTLCITIYGCVAEKKNTLRQERRVLYWGV